jgi:CRP/FNR family cyclic AMP-dependent transcriptional regulator
MHIDYAAEAEVWTEGTFVPSGFALTSLLEAAGRVDFALLITTAVDSVSTSRGHIFPVARDNVVFETGLFAGRLGLERTFLLVPRGTDLRLPSDLDGITPIDWDPMKANLESALGPACTRLKSVMTTVGLRS